ncbi:MAG: FecR family protein [Halanaerobiales bacterium]|nr:FecR family protein [Halanaerobiales bacterium]
MKRFLIVLIILSIMVQVMASADNTITITGIEGRVERKIKKSIFFDWLKFSQWQQLTANDRLMVGDIIKTGVDSSLEISFVQDIYVKIGQQSRVIIGQRTVTEKGPAYSLELKAGQLWARVKDAWQELTRFEVVTPSAVAGVRGTLFSVAFINNQTIVTVKEGKVEVRDAASTSRKIIAGNEMGIVDGTMIEDKTISREQLKLWEEKGVKDWIAATARDKSEEDSNSSLSEEPDQDDQVEENEEEREEQKDNDYGEEEDEDDQDYEKEDEDDPDQDYEDEEEDEWDQDSEDEDERDQRDYTGDTEENGDNARGRAVGKQKGKGSQNQDDDDE